MKCLQMAINLLERLVERDRQESMAAKLRTLLDQHAMEMAQCLSLHRQAYGLKYIPSQVVDAVQVGLRVLVHQLEYTVDVRQAFIELCRFGIVLSQKFRPISETIQHIQSLSHRGVIWLPAEASAVLDGSELRRGLET